MSDMDKLESKLKLLKEALLKNVNMSYGEAAPNAAPGGGGDSAMKAEANPKPKKPSGGHGGAPANPMPPAPKPRPTEMIKYANNGQWSLKKEE